MLGTNMEATALEYLSGLGTRRVGEEALCFLETHGRSLPGHGPDHVSHRPFSPRESMVGCAWMYPLSRAVGRAQTGRKSNLRVFSKKIRSAIQALRRTRCRKSPKPIPINDSRRATRLSRAGSWNARSDSDSVDSQGRAEQKVSVTTRISSYTGLPVRVYTRRLRISDFAEWGGRVRGNPCTVIKIASFPIKRKRLPKQPRSCDKPPAERVAEPADLGKPPQATKKGRRVHQGWEPRD